MEENAVAPGKAVTVLLFLHVSSPVRQLNRRADMQKQQHGDRLSRGDSVFLHLEREGMPLNVACLCVFEGEIPFEDCVQFVEAKLPLIPRYLKRVVPPPFNIGLPSWEYDANFDIRSH